MKNSRIILGVLGSLITVSRKSHPSREVTRTKTDEILHEYPTDGYC